jgi:L-seryl-tRNA selenium transferase
MLQLSNEELRLRAEELLTRLRDLPVCVSVGKGKAQVGGGTLPPSIIPSVTIDLSLKNPRLNEVAARLRHSAPPFVGYSSFQ